jgi:hypothetical protein
MLADIATAAPVKRTLTAEREIVALAEGVGCTTDEVTAIAGTGSITRVFPQEGDDLGDGVIVQHVEISGRRATWTLGPTPETCAANDARFEARGWWRWATGSASWIVAHRGRFYVVEATRRDGVKSLAGFRAAPRSRQYSPSIRRAIRMFGKPSTVRGSRYGSVCYVWWRRLGLTTTFMNLGGWPPCQRGYLQSARISGRHAGRWAIVVGGRRGTPVTAGTSLRYLRSEMLGRYNYRSDAWALSEDYLPYGPDPGYTSTVSALFAGRGSAVTGESVIRGFDLWIGAAGE